jgi:FAD synthetase
MVVKIASGFSIWHFPGTDGEEEGTVLLHLLVAVRSRRYRRRTSRKEELYNNGANGCACAQGSKPAPLSLKSVYITCSSPFDAVEEFVSETRDLYNLALFRTSPAGIPMKEALSIYQQVDPDVKAILVGTRRDDPHGSACSTLTTIFVVASTDRSFHVQANSTSKHQQTQTGLPFCAYTR